LQAFATSDAGAHWQAAPILSPGDLTLTSANSTVDLAAVLPDGHLVLHVGGTNFRGPAGRDYAYSSHDGGCAGRSRGSCRLLTPAATSPRSMTPTGDG
jgi:hypothetical protein